MANNFNFSNAALGYGSMSPKDFLVPGQTYRVGSREGWVATYLGPNPDYKGVGQFRYLEGPRAGQEFRAFIDDQDDTPIFPTNETRAQNIHRTAASRIAGRRQNTSNRRKHALAAWNKAGNTRRRRTNRKQTRRHRRV